MSSPTHTTYAASTFPAQAVDAFHLRVQSAIQGALDILQEPIHRSHLRVFFVRSRDDMETLAGARFTGMTDVPSQTVLVVANETWTPFTRHEVMHAVSLLLWSEPGNALGVVPVGSQAWRRGGWLREGLAARAEDRCGAYSNKAVAAAFAAVDSLIPIADLADRFYDQPDFASYLQAGSLIEFILSRHGLEQFRTLWNTFSIEDSLRMSLAGLDNAWAAWLGAVPKDDLPDLEALRARGCG